MDFIPQQWKSNNTDLTSSCLCVFAECLQSCFLCCGSSSPFSSLLGIIPLHPNMLWCQWFILCSAHTHISFFLTSWDLYSVVRWQNMTSAAHSLRHTSSPWRSLYVFYTPDSNTLTKCVLSFYKTYVWALVVWNIYLMNNRAPQKRMLYIMSLSEA